jgi:NNP family nitrate/nitrite transporter-like MFS transporter
MARSLNGPDHPQRWRMLHFTWAAFFLTFVVWFNLAPFASTIARALHLTPEQVKTLLRCNLALTIPARIGVGMLVDRFGPRRVFTTLLLVMSIPCILCAFAHTYLQLVILRLFISCIGAGFVVGIRLVSEWFSPREIGLAEGIYGGLGNFGMFAATFGLPLLALVFPEHLGWRIGMGLSGALCIAWAFVFYRNVIDAPPGTEFKRPKKKGALEVCSKGDLIALLLMQMPMVLSLGIVTWNLTKVHLLPEGPAIFVYACLAALLVQQWRKIWSANLILWRPDKSIPTEERYAFSQVAILCLCYAVTFGGELAVESMLPGHFEKMFGLSVAFAGFLSAGFTFASLLARPLGGWLGDRIGRRPIMIVSLAGSAAGYFAISAINARWSVPAAGAVVMLVGLFLMAANGAAFAVAPLIRKPLTGQITGLIGAYGSVGSVLFLFVLSMGSPTFFFLTMAACGTAAFAACFLLREPVALPQSAPALAESAVTAAAPAVGL